MLFLYHYAILYHYLDDQDAKIENLMRQLIQLVTGKITKK